MSNEEAVYVLQQVQKSILELRDDAEHYAEMWRNDWEILDKASYILLDTDEELSHKLERAAKQKKKDAIAEQGRVNALTDALYPINGYLAIYMTRANAQKEEKD